MADSSKRVAIFGGSFNPPHLGHTFVTSWALATCPVDEVWWVPAFSHAFGKDLAPFPLRAELCELAVRHFARVRVCRVEGEMKGESRTIDTLEELSRRFDEFEFSLLIGADLVPTLPRWKRAEDLQAFYPIYVVGRGQMGATGTPIAIPDVSSSELRRALSSGDDSLPSSWMDAAVLAALPAGLYDPPANSGA